MMLTSLSTRKESGFFQVSGGLQLGGDYPFVMGIYGERFKKCSLCKRAIRSLGERLEVSLEPEQGRRWPDVIGAGSPFLIVSASVVKAFENENLGVLPTIPVTIVDSFSSELMDRPMPDYVCIDGSQCFGARLDFDASGYVDVRFCDECGNRTHDISQTYDKQRRTNPPYVFEASSWTGKHLFTTNLSPAAFFCTEKVVDAARKHRLTNFEFVPIEWGTGYSGPGISYGE